MTHSEPDNRRESKEALGGGPHAAGGEFEDVLANIKEAAAPQLVSDAFRRTLDRMAGTYRSYVPDGLLARMYADESPRKAQAALRSEQEAVEAELCLSPDHTAADLRRIRREFALANHPDRVAPSWRQQATRRMTIANSLIDNALTERQGGIS